MLTSRIGQALSPHFGLFGHFVDQDLGERVAELHLHPLALVDSRVALKAVKADKLLGPDPVHDAVNDRARTSVLSRMEGRHGQDACL